MFKLLQQAKQHVERWMRGNFPDAPTRRFIEFNKKKWPSPRRTAQDPVVLVGLFPHQLQTYCYSYITNHIARKTGARIESFRFTTTRNKIMEKVYASFGAPLRLSPANSGPFKQVAAQRAEEIFRSLKTKADVEQIEFDGVIIGDLIYDTYLRMLALTTVDLQDERLKQFIYEGLLIAFTTKDYLARNKVVAVIPDHVVYMYCAVLVRVAAKAKVPIYFPYYGRDFFYIYPLDIESPPFPIRWPHYQYRDLFAQLDPAAQERAIAAAREALQERLRGKVNDAVLPGQSAYGTGTGTKVLEETGRPRVLILLHDFCDAVHVYRGYLFPDFEEWIYFLLSRAVKTPFDWYVKPHPNINNQHRAYRTIGETNRAVIARLKSEFPTVRFLDPKVSNRQIVDEGISAMFTVCGTAGHEFAYLGVPVANSGDNPHCAYPFNLNARSVEEYEKFIFEADRLKAPIEKRDVEEYFHMNYFYFKERYNSGINLFDPELLESPHAGSSQIFDDLMADANPERDRQVAAYFDQLFSPAQSPKNTTAGARKVMEATASSPNP
jgi:hypothetical protein